MQFLRVAMAPLLQHYPAVGPKSAARLVVLVLSIRLLQGNTGLWFKSYWNKVPVHGCCSTSYPKRCRCSPLAYITVIQMQIWPCQRILKLILSNNFRAQPPVNLEGLQKVKDPLRCAPELYSSLVCLILLKLIVRR